jgi:hypothetical protein
MSNAPTNYGDLLTFIENVEAWKANRDQKTQRAIERTALEWQLCAATPRALLALGGIISHAPGASVTTGQRLVQAVEEVTSWGLVQFPFGVELFISLLEAPRIEAMYLMDELCTHTEANVTLSTSAPPEGWESVWRGIYSSAHPWAWSVGHEILEALPGALPWGDEAEEEPPPTMPSNPAPLAKEWPGRTVHGFEFKEIDGDMVNAQGNIL